MDPPLKIPRGSEWDEWRSRDLCYDQGQVFPQTFGQDVLAGIGTEVRHLDVPSLAGYMHRRGLIGDAQYSRLTESRTTAEDKILELSRMLVLVPKARDPPQFIKKLYLALCDSYEDDVGQENHYQFAQTLKNKALASLKCPVETYERRMRDLSTVLAKVPSVTVSEDQCRQLRHNLGLSVSPGKGNLKNIVDEWYNNCSARPSLAVLVKALMLTPGLGRHVSRLLPYCLSNCPGVCVHIRNLKDNWNLLAEYMGYTRAEVEVMKRGSAGAKQFQTFLRVWRMPHCNGSEVAILEEVMRRAARYLSQQLVGGMNAGDVVAVNDPDKQNRPQRSGSEHNADGHLAPQQMVNIHYSTQYNVQVPSIRSGIDVITQPFTNATLPAVMGYPLESTLRQLSLQNSPPVYTEVQPPPLNIPGFDRQVYKDGTVPTTTTQPLTQPGQMPPQSAQPAAPGATMSATLPQVSQTRTGQYEASGSPVVAGQYGVSGSPAVAGQYRVASPMVSQLLEHPTAVTATSSQPLVTSTTSIVVDPLHPQLPQASVLRVSSSREAAPKAVMSKPSDGTALLEACKVDDWPTAMALVNSGCSLEARSKLDARTPLLIVCLKQNADFAIKLVKNRADVLALDVNGQCCLHYPETLRNAKLAKYLITVYRIHDYSLDIPDTERSYTPLMVACTQGDGVHLVAESLLKSGAKPNGDPSAHTHPLIEACSGGHTRLVELLLKHHADADIVDKTGSTALLQAAYKNHWNIVDFLVEHGANVNKAEYKGTTVLFIAVGANALPMVKKLITKGALVNARRMQYGVTKNVLGQAEVDEVEETPLAHACARGFQSIAELLIDKGADINYLCTGSVPPLGFAIILSQMHIVKFLLRCPQLDKSLRGLQAPIIISVKMEKWDYTRVLLQELGGKDEALKRTMQNQLHELAEHIQMFMVMTPGPEAPSTPRLPSDGTELLEACKLNDWATAMALVNSGCSLEARSQQEGRTPLMIACLRRSTDSAIKLVKNRADVLALDVDGQCCLHYPETLRNTKLANYLISVYVMHDFSLDTPDTERSYTPLMVACTLGDGVHQVAESLLKDGANPNGDPRARSCPLIEACTGGHSRLVELLLKYGADANIVDKTGSTALLQAAFKNQWDVVDILVDHRANVNKAEDKGTTVLFIAVGANALPMVEKLITKGANVNARRIQYGVTQNALGQAGVAEETPLAHACARGFQSIAEILIDKGADINYLCTGTMPPLGFAITWGQMHIVKFLLKCPQLDKSLHGLQVPIIVAVKMEKWEYTELLLQELGGKEEALRKAKQNQLHELAEEIELFENMQNPGANVPSTFRVEPGSEWSTEMEVQCQRSKTDKILKQFSQICVKSIVDNCNVKLEDVEAAMKAIGQQHVANLLTRSFEGTQNQETLKTDFLGGSPSAAQCLIENGLLLAEDFQAEALKCFRDEPGEFYKDLVFTFHQIPGLESLPDDVQAVLTRFFTGQLQFSIQSTETSRVQSSTTADTPVLYYPPPIALPRTTASAGLESVQLPGEGGLSECSICHVSVRKEDLEQHYLNCEGYQGKEQRKPFEEVEAVHTFQTTEQGRLSVEAGDILVVLKKDVQVGWWLVKRGRDNDQGLVPSACLQPVPPKGSHSVKERSRDSRQPFLKGQGLSLDRPRMFGEEQQGAQGGDSESSRVHGSAAAVTPVPPCPPPNHLPPTRASALPESVQLPGEGGLSECSLCHISMRKEDLPQHYLICEGYQGKEQNDILGLDDIDDVIEKVKKATSDWKPLGRKLLTVTLRHKLKSIESENRSDDKRLYAMLEVWLTDKPTLKPSWRSLKEALIQIGRGDLAENINGTLATDSSSREPVLPPQPSPSSTSSSHVTTAKTAIPGSLNVEEESSSSIPSDVSRTNSGPEVPSTPRLELEGRRPRPQPSSETELLRQQVKTDEVLCQFAEICMRSIVEKPNVNLKDVISAMKALGYQHFANLLTRCFNGTQNNEALKTDFLGGNPSAAQCLIENRLLSSEDFQAEALKYFQYEPRKFYEDLVWVFHQTPGGESLPYDVQAVLTRFFTGQIQFNIQSTGGQEPVGGQPDDLYAGQYQASRMHRSTAAVTPLPLCSPPEDLPPTGASVHPVQIPGEGGISECSLCHISMRKEDAPQHYLYCKGNPGLEDALKDVPDEKLYQECSNDDLNVTSQSLRKPLEMVKSVHAFQTTKPGQLSVETGDILLVLKEDVSVGWWLVKRERDNLQGLVPSAFLQSVASEGSLSEEEVPWMHRSTEAVTPVPPCSPPNDLPPTRASARPQSVQLPDEGGLSECSLCHISMRKEDLPQHYLNCEGYQGTEQSTADRTANPGSLNVGEESSSSIPSDVSRTPDGMSLIEACMAENWDRAFYLVKSGFNVEEKAQDGTTPLFTAVEHNKQDLVLELLNRKANPNVIRHIPTPESGTVEETPLAHACARGFLEIVKLLVQFDADLNYCCSGTFPILGFAALTDQYNIMNFLLTFDRLDTSLNKVSIPIMVAIKGENNRCATLLLKKLGGHEVILNEARRRQMNDLVEQIEEYVKKVGHVSGGMQPASHKGDILEESYRSHYHGRPRKRILAVQGFDAGQLQRLQLGETEVKSRIFHRVIRKFAPDVKILEVEQIRKLLGRGAFGQVVELRCKGYDHPLAGKILNDEDLGASDEQADRAVKRFCREYKCLSTLKPHRNIVQYQGICFTVKSDFPVLVMELMPTDLHNYLLHEGNLPLQRKITILYEIARGLVYLHSNRIVHRDLTAKNVLLDASGTPKISDFGNSRLIDNVSATSYLGLMTGQVGTRFYMAPEVEMESAHYNEKVDVFSFGHLALFVSIQIYPRSLLPCTYTVRRVLAARSEVERRQEYFKKLPTHFPLTLLMKKCLEDVVSRPNSAVVKQELSRLR